MGRILLRLGFAVIYLIWIVTPSLLVAQSKKPPDVGTISGDAPGCANRSEHSKAIPSEEREALEAIYKATVGDHWTNSGGWLGPPGTECDWHGVACVQKNDDMYILGLDLYENNLAGTIPKEIGELKKLQWLDLATNNLTGPIPSALGQLGALEDLTLLENHLSGLVPDPLIQRWLAGPLDIIAETSLLSDVSEIDFESSASSALCARHRIILRSDNSVVSYTERCRNATPDDRTTFCEVKEGRIGRGEFAKLGWLVKNDRFFDMGPEFYRNMTHGVFEDTRVTEDGKVHAVSNYAGAGPFELWVIQRAIEGVAASVEWEKTSTQENCPRW